MLFGMGLDHVTVSVQSSHSSFSICLQMVFKIFGVDQVMRKGLQGSQMSVFEQHGTTAAVDRGCRPPRADCGTRWRLIGRDP